MLFNVSRAFVAIAIVLSSVVFNSCRKENIPEEEHFDVEEVVTPIEDELSEKCVLAAYFSPNIADNEYLAAIKKRFNNVAATFDKNTKVIFLDAKDITTLPAEKYDLLADAYLENARILIYNATPIQIIEFNERMYQMMTDR